MSTRLSGAVSFHALSGWLARVSRVVVLGVLVIVGAVVMPASAEAAPEPVTVFTFAGEPGEPLTGGTSGKLRAPAASFQMIQDRDTTRINVWNNSDRWSVDLAPPSGERLRPGVYTDVERAGFQHGRAAGLSVTRGGGCNQVFGRVTINQVTYDASGGVTMLDAGFVQHCESESTPALRGTVRYRALPLSFRFQSDPGDYAGAGRTKTFTGANSLFYLDRIARNGMRFIASGLRESWTVEISPPQGEQLHVGTYQDTRLPWTAEPGQPGLYAGGNQCDSTTFGTFTIHELEVDAAGDPTALSLTFIQHCNGNPDAALHGTVHYYA